MPNRAANDPDRMVGAPSGDPLPADLQAARDKDAARIAAWKEMAATADTSERLTREEVERRYLRDRSATAGEIVNGKVAKGLQPDLPIDPQLDSPPIRALFQRGDFTLASGAKSGWKIECDALMAEDWAALSLMLAERLPPFSVIFGVPCGGIPLARALSDYSDPASMAWLVVDDVWTTGGSMQRFIDAEVRPLTPMPLLRAVVFARNPVPDGVTALFTMTGDVGGGS